MSGLALRSKRHHRPELPLVPLIDVLVMLVLFSFVTMRFASTQTLNITLPKVETAGKNLFAGGITLSIDKDGLIQLNGRIVPRDQLRGLLEQIKRAKNDVQVLISADEKTPFEHVTFVMDACRLTGISKFNVQTR